MPAIRHHKVTVEGLGCSSAKPEITGKAIDQLGIGEYAIYFALEEEADEIAQLTDDLLRRTFTK